MRTALLRRLDTDRATFIRMWAAAASGDPEALRRVRIAARRLREVLRIVDAAGGTRRAAALTRTLRAIRRALGAVRDDAVVRACVAEFGERASWAAAVREIDALLAARGRRWAKVLDQTLSPRRLAKLSAAVAALTRSVARRHLHAAYATALRRALVSRTADARRAVDAAGPVYEPEQLHALRIAIKKLRYAVELAARSSIVPATFVGRLRRHQQRLGAWHDYAAVVDFMRIEEARREPQDPDAWAALLAAVDRRARVLFGQIRRAHASLDRCVGDIRAAVAGAVLGTRRRPARAALAETITRRGAGRS